MESVTDIKKFLLTEAGYWTRCEAFKKCSYGDKNRYKKFRIVCNKSPYAYHQGLISTISIILPYMIEARLHGYIPVVDLCKNSRCQIMLQEPELAKKENAWEYYFTQPNREISLEEVRQSRYVEEQIKHCSNTNYYLGDGNIRGGILTQLIRWGIHQNIHLQPKIKNKLIREKRRLFSDTDRILGIGIRAGYRWGIMGDYSVLNGHPMVGSCAECIKSIEKKLAEWNYDTFFLAIDDREYLEEIKKYFGGSCISTERPRMHFFRDALKDIPEAGEDAYVEVADISMRNQNEDYLVELYLLAQCDSLYSYRGTGYNFSYLINNGRYSRVEFEDLGEFNYAK